MKTPITLALIFATLVSIGTTGARPDRTKSSLSTNEDLEAEPEFVEVHSHYGGQRRTRHSRHIFQGYSQPYYEPFESRFLFLLEEINVKLKLISEQLSSRSTSNPIVVPYPYPVPINMDNMSIPNIDGRFSGPVWGVVGAKPQTSRDGDDDDGSRPISLNPSKQNIPEGVRTPPVEHGSVQAQKSPTTTTQRPIAVQESQTTPRVPTKCEAAIINCCRFSEPDVKNCFQQLQCQKTYMTGKACLPEVIKMVIKVFTDAYKPR